MVLVAGIVLAINVAPVPDEGTVALGLAAIALAAGVAFVLRQRRAAIPLYDLEVAVRRMFWVAACARIIVFGSLMGAMFVGQQFLQNVPGCSSIDAGAAILPAVFCMVLAAPRSARLVEAKGARFTLLSGYVFCLLGFITMLLFWKDGVAYWLVGLAYAFVGIGVGLAGTPASHSLTGSVPVTRAGMASGTADLQRDLGGAIMQSTSVAPSCSRSRERYSPPATQPQWPTPSPVRPPPTRRRSPTASRRSSSARSPAPKRWPNSIRSTHHRSPRQPRRRSSTAPTGPCGWHRRHPAGRGPGVLPVPPPRRRETPPRRVPRSGRRRRQHLILDLVASSSASSGRLGRGLDAA